MGDVLANFLEPLSVRYPLAASTDRREFFRDFVSLMKAYPDDTLVAARLRIVSTRTLRSFPLPAECLEACREAENDAAKARQVPHRDTGLDEWSDWRIAEADRLICSAMGRGAAANAWIIGLHDYCRVNRRLPDVHEANEIRRKGAELAAELAELGPGHIMAPLIRSRAVRAGKLAGIANGARRGGTA